MYILFVYFRAMSLQCWCVFHCLGASPAYFWLRRLVLGRNTTAISTYEQNKETKGSPVVMEYRQFECASQDSPLDLYFNKTSFAGCSTKSTSLPWGSPFDTTICWK